MNISISLDVGSGIQQRADHIHVAAAGREMQRSGVIAEIARVRVRIVLGS